MKNSKLRRKHFELKKKSYNVYLIMIKMYIVLSPKMFYGFVNSKRRVSLFPLAMTYETTTSCDIHIIWNILAIFQI